ncbi:hypothetical protein AVEN_273508-1 [Araneus ventricosus]|uniref:DUF4817 domain-containing protein n=1 Tax=Araneus ventricosus TaxID=182803 RepID=A0A4Y2H3X2_ARAVE|nr:hypothetical protein AVEN_273508-1 [Araneus ventricosus]
MVLSLEQRIYLVLEYNLLEHSYFQARRSFQRRFDVRGGQSGNAINALFEKFKRTGNVNDERIRNIGRLSSSVTESNADVVQQVILQQSRTSVRRVASRAGLRRMTTPCIMCHNLHIFPCKIQTRQPLSVNAINARYDFANAMLQLVDEGDIYVGNIRFSDEAYFNFDGFVNKQNWRIWGTENPHVALPSFLYSPKVMVWDAISSKGIIGPFFREQTINVAKYLGILDEFVAIHYALSDRWNAS